MKTDVKQSPLSESILLSVMISMLFLFHLIISAVSTLVFALLLTVLIIAYIIAGRVDYSLTGYHLVWFGAVSLVLMNYFLQYRDRSVLIDAVVLFNCFLLVFFASSKPDIYANVMIVIKTFSIFFAVSVFVQKYLPGLYQFIGSHLPSKIYSAVMVSDGSSAGLRGFTTNPGFTAGYIIVGIIAFIADKSGGNKLSKKEIITISALFFALLNTSKRGPLLFFVLTILIVYTVTSDLFKNKRTLKVMFVIIIAMVALFLLLEPFIEGIPVINKFRLNIERLQVGKDVSSGRGDLYDWAIRLFMGNPVFGIGWGNYPSTVVSLGAIGKELQTHNVYLQLLSETGLVGFILFAGIFIASWISARRTYFRSLRCNDSTTIVWQRLLLFSLSYQTYFLLYCLTGNPLYDNFFVIIYGLSCAIPVGFCNYKERTGLE